MKKTSLILSGIFFLLVVLGGLFLFGRYFNADHGREGGGEAHPGVVAGAIKYVCGMHPFVVKDEPGNCPICGMELTPTREGEEASAAQAAAERKIKYWVAPMDPTYIRDEPGKSPMGMDLVPVYEDESGSGSIITIDPVTIQNMNIRTARVVRRDLRRTIRTVGLVNYEESRQYAVNTKVSGWIEKLHINQTGTVVKRGEPLLDIYSPQLVSAQEEYLLALENFHTAEKSASPSLAERSRRLYESSQKRLKLWDISDGQIQRLKRTGKVRKLLTLYAPYDGIVSSKMAYEGMYAKPGMELFQISDISRVWIYADIYEYELPWVEVGQEAEVILPFVGGKIIQARVDYIYPYVEPQTRTVKARLELKNPEFNLKPDMFVNVRLKSKTVAGALTVPAEAVLRSGEKETVFIALEGGKFEPRRVKTGLQSEDGALEIIQGLFEAEKVVTSAQFMLDSESNLREAIRKMLEPEMKSALPEHSGHEGQKGQGELEGLFEKPSDKDLEGLFK